MIHVISVMYPAGKSRSSRSHKKTRKWLLPLVVFLIAVIGTATYLFYPAANSNSSIQPTPTPSSAFAAFTDHYLAIMNNLNSTQTKSKMASLLNPSCNQTDLFTWEGSRLTFANDATGFYEDPFQILNSGDGICVQWSIVYVSACLALGYQSRLVVAADTASWTYIHVWAEDYYNGAWVHVDPSDKVWNNPSRYQSWPWGKYIGSGVRIYAFEDGKYVDVTSTYSV